ncbi:MAG: alkaline phosphatase family protein [Rhodothermales bacterium]
MPAPDHILFVFVDGIGLGPATEDANPFARLRLPGFERLAGGAPLTDRAAPIREADHAFFGIDATLEVEGLPQSGTGQAALFTGLNAPRLAGQHYGPYPPTATYDAIASANIFRQIATQTGIGIGEQAFANAYPPPFFTHAETRNRWTVTTRCCREAGVRIRTMDDLRAGEALAADLTNRGLRDKLGIDVDPVTEETAADRLARLARRHRFTLFEYYLTDKAGHSQDVDTAAGVLASFDRFLGTLLETFDPRDTLFVLTSDHGNLEDLSTRSHTRNPVPFAALGAGAAQLHEVRDLTEVVPALLRLWQPA